MALLWEMFSTSAACLREMFFEVGWFLLDFLSPSHLIEMLQPPYGLEDILEIVMALLLLLVIGFFVAYTINGIHAVFVHRHSHTRFCLGKKLKGVVAGTAFGYK